MNYQEESGRENRKQVFVSFIYKAFISSILSTDLWLKTNAYGLVKHVTLWLTLLLQTSYNDELPCVKANEHPGMYEKGYLLEG